MFVLSPSYMDTYASVEMNRNINEKVLEMLLSEVKRGNLRFFFAFCKPFVHANNSLRLFG